MIPMTDDDIGWGERRHTAHYGQMDRDALGRLLSGPIWDALTDAGRPITLWQVRDRLVEDHRVKKAKSWFLSYGQEQHEEGVGAYQGWPVAREVLTPTSEEADAQYRYALAERVAWQLNALRRTRSVRTVGLTKSWKVLSNFPEPDLTDKQVYSVRPRSLLVPGRPPKFIEHREWTHHEGLRNEQRILANEIEAALEKKTIRNARELLERAQRLLEDR